MPDLRSSPIAAFTAIELMLVLAVIAALAGVSLPLLATVRRNSQVNATRSVVHALAATIANHPAKAWTVSEADAGELRERSYRIWDVNRDGLIDGDPVLEDPLLPAGNRYPVTIASSGYRGLVGMTKPALPKRFHDPRSGRPLDAWGRPLRIAYAPLVYGSLGFGIWSAGPDGLDAPVDERGDDIRSWETETP